MHQVAREVLPTTVVTDLDGQSREFRDSSGSIYLVFAMALAFIYLVLAAQFESWRNPFIIMLSVPLSMTGALLARCGWWRHAVDLQPDRAHHAGGPDHQAQHPDRRIHQSAARRGRELFEAVTEASVLRLRPILMTTGAMVLGTVPLACRMAPAPNRASRSAGSWWVG